MGTKASIDSGMEDLQLEGGNTFTTNAGSATMREAKISKEAIF